MVGSDEEVLFAAVLQEPRLELRLPIFAQTQFAQVLLDFPPAFGVHRTNSVVPEEFQDGVILRASVHGFQNLIHCVKDAAEWSGGGGLFASLG